MTQTPHETSPLSAGHDADMGAHNPMDVETLRGLKKRPLSARLNSQAQPCEGMDSPLKLAQQAQWRHRAK